MAQYGDRLWVSVLDGTDTPAVRRVVDQALAKMGRIYVIVNNAGYGLFGAAEEVSEEQVRHQIDTNFIDSITVIRACLPQLRAPGVGRFPSCGKISGSIEIGDESGLSRAPPQLCLRLLTGGYDIQGGKVCKPGEMGRRLFRTFADDGNVQAPADHFGNFPVDHTFFSNRVVAGSLSRLVQGKLVNTCRIESVHGGPSICART